MMLNTLTSMAAAGLIAVCALPAHAGDSCRSGSHQAKTAGYGNRKDIVDTAVAAGSFKTLAAALEAAGLVDALKGEGPFTVFAPTDEAFAKLPKGTVGELVQPKNKGLLTAILTYHVAPGRFTAKDVVSRTNLKTLNGQRIDINTSQSVRIDDATVIKTDIECANGVIHVIDRVIMPSTDNILETAAKAGSFQTLATALKAAGLAKSLSGEGPFTVFAPTDAAFAKLPAGTLESLLEPQNRHRLIEILKYHVVSGRVYAKDAIGAETAQTLAGSRIRLKLGSAGLLVNDATVIEPDLEASNGVIHVIDQVILPD
ncbi:MAG: fasciclin domain-containing protein [Planctomycetota bacterium]|jgi:uncharacterized surface protein with fasciclin (FAS1) repeats